MKKIKKQYLIKTLRKIQRINDRLFDKLCDDNKSSIQSTEQQKKNCKINQHVIDLLACLGEDAESYVYWD